MKSLFANVDAGLIGLIFFFAVFVGIAIWAFQPGRKQQIESHKYIPLEEESDEPR